MPSYSSVVRSLRIVVPALGILLLVLFFLWPVVTKINLPKIDKAQISGDRTELVNPRYEGQDEKGQRYLLTANRAIQSRNKPNEVELVSPTAALIGTDNAEGTRVIAQHGIYHDQSENLQLSDQVTMTTPEGDQFISSAAQIDLKNKIVTGDQPVTGSGPRLELSAQGFTYDRNQGTLTLSGPAKLILKEQDETHSSDTAAPAAD